MESTMNITQVELTNDELQQVTGGTGPGSVYATGGAVNSSYYGRSAVGGPAGATSSHPAAVFGGGASAFNGYATSPYVGTIDLTGGTATGGAGFIF